MKRVLFVVVGLLFLTACQEKEFLTPEVGETTIVKNRKVEDLHFPFADLEELNQFKANSDVVHYEMVFIENRNQAPKRDENYHSVDWWNPWFLVWD